VNESISFGPVSDWHIIACLINETAHNCQVDYLYHNISRVFNNQKH